MMEKFDLKEIQGKMNDALSFVKSKIEGFVSEDEAFWMAVAMFLLGVIVGIFISPKGRDEGFWFFLRKEGEGKDISAKWVTV